MENTFSHDYGCQYTFTHKETGQKKIAQSWPEYWQLDQDTEYRRGRLLGYNDVPGAYDKKFNCHSVNHEFNKFWESLKGYERFSNLDCGIPCSGQFNGIRLFLRNIKNHACMIGDSKLYWKVYNDDKVFHDNGMIHVYLLNA